MPKTLLGSNIYLSSLNFYQKYRLDFRLNLKLAYPIMLGQMGQITVNIADNIMVGKLGAEGLAAVSVANAIFVIFLVIGMGIAFALPPLVSEADGAKDYRSISQYFKHSLVINMSFAIIAMAAIFMILPLLKYAGQNPDVLAEALPYLKISAISLIPFMLFLTMRSYCDGLSYTKLPMYAIIFGNVINILLNYLLIFGNGGFPELGVAGAATGSLIARTMMLALLVYFVYKNEYLWTFIKEAKFKVYQSYIFIKTLRLGIPTSLQMFFEISAFSAAALIMGMVGKQEQAAHQISINLASITFLICTGIGMAATIRVGNQLGQKNYIKLRDAGISTILQVVIFMIVAAIIFILFRNFLPTLYIQDEEVIKIAATLLIAAAIFQIPDGVQVTTLGALRGLQDVTVPTIITFISYWIFGIPVSYYLALKTDMGPIGVWVGLTVGLSISATLLTMRFLRLTKSRKV